MKNKGCRKYFWNAIGRTLHGESITRLTILLLALVPLIVITMQLFPFDGLNIVLRTHFRIHLSIWNATHAMCLLTWLYSLYSFGTGILLIIFSALYCGISLQFWLKFASHTFRSKAFREANCEIPKFRFRHYQQLRLVASIFNQSFANKTVTG